MHASTPYPLFVRLAGEKVVVIGAGDVAARKVQTMLAYEAKVTVVAPEATQAIRELARDGALVWKQRRYREGDLQDAMLAIAATSERGVNEAVHAEARRQKTLVNVVDVPELCTCIVPSILRRGQLQVAVSTNGAAPSVAREMRRKLECEIEPWWELYVDMLGELRILVKENVPGAPARRAPLYEAVTAAGLEQRFAAGEAPTAQEVFDTVVVPMLKGGTR